MKLCISSKKMLQVRVPTCCWSWLGNSKSLYLLRLCWGCHPPSEAGRHQRAQYSLQPAYSRRLSEVQSSWRLCKPECSHIALLFRDSSSVPLHLYRCTQLSELGRSSACQYKQLASQMVTIDFKILKLASDKLELAWSLPIKPPARSRQVARQNFENCGQAHLFCISTPQTLSCLS